MNVRAARDFIFHLTGPHYKPNHSTEAVLTIEESNNNLINPHYTHSTTTLSTLPPELIELIFSFLSPLHAPKYTRLNRRINECLSTPHFALENLSHTVPKLIPTNQTSTRILTSYDRAWFVWPKQYQEAYARGWLRDVRKLEWGSNKISGVIPSTIGALTGLRSLLLHDNWLHGRIPAQMGLLKELEELYLNDNSLSGEIPKEISGLDLKLLILFRNCLSGSIPSSLGRMQSLVYLDLSSNLLSGSVPVEICGLSNLQYLNLSANQLSGRIPAEMSNLKELQVLDLSHNKLEGSIPAGFGSMRNLVCLCLHANCLSGVVPIDLFGLEQMELMLLLTGNQVFLEYDSAGIVARSRVFALLQEFEVNEASDVVHGLPDRGVIFYADI
ncbi:hypothetical protein HDU79_007463 [Rhizoclosmatium sp. JEL0117]|nr:hypothetical protein HDU79_007463 [Rhizoclosmatium sp. JEL0117]